ncbi:MAG TPA: tetratricopeptide repeat protein, partial [Verrucomicrobiae bacterium]
MKISGAIDSNAARAIALEGHGSGNVERRIPIVLEYAGLRSARLALGVLLLFALVLLIYLPMLHGSFVMDDARLVGPAANPLVNGQLTVGSVWFQTDFPLTLCVWRAEWLLWGDHPLGYHAVNMALQALSAVLIWRVLVRLNVRGAWLGAAIFAVHPVAVGSVARIAELKNTLSLPFFLLSFWAYLRYETASLYPPREPSEKPPGFGAPNLFRAFATNSRNEFRAPIWFALSFISFILALLSKTTVIALPVALLGCAAWQRGRITRRDVAHTAPYFIVALAFGLMSIWFQKYQALAGEMVPSQTFAERLGVAGRNFWFYFGKALWPSNLTVFYSRWRTDHSLLAEMAPLLAIALLFAVCWRFRRGWGRHALLGIGCFTLLLFPSLGFFDAQCFTKFQVSDHLQYLPLIAMTSLIGAVLAAIPRRRIFFSGTVGVLAVMSLLSIKRAAIFATEEGLLRDTLAKNSAAWPAHNDLGVILARQGKIPAAADQFKAALQSQPNEPEALANLAQCDAVQGRFAEACGEYRQALRLKPDNAALHEGLAGALENLGHAAEATGHLKIALRFAPKSSTRLSLAGLLYQTGDYRAATDQYRQVLSSEPDN